MHHLFSFFLFLLTDVPVLSSLYIQDQYSSPLDGQYPHFFLKGAARSDKLWARQMDQLFVHKMSELMRVQFITQLLHTGPEVEKGVSCYSEVSPKLKVLSQFGL